ncbi:PepSY-associated TM helix domain-containing protein [Microcoleus sp. FACHB-672]|uniref:PepSY-associated TM helix domain-containing protein n=1 Tax=Microcoleus sp. FACHB-672 TaxID=2692825 RepID=UPI0016847B93|nr:PepSY-associated TM helix domain-containing protein [Microcoleus sp. FACHB-672]MBD2040612.1 PepSY domain-containing protein [Microcoleus sp. FACHB-672]
MKLRQLALSVHRYLGILVGLILVLIGLTGSFLVFHKEINEFLNPHLSHVIPQGERISVQSVVDTVRSAYPDLTLSFIDLPKKIDSVYKVAMTSKNDELLYFYLNPYTGNILGSQQWGRTLTTFIYDLHYKLLAGETGMKVVGICGILLLLLSITGIILWPGWKKLISGFKIRWNSPSRLINYDLHKVGGIFSAIFLIIIAFTGTAIIFYTEFENTVYSITQTSHPPELTSKVVKNKPVMSIDAILKKADAALPGAKTTFVSLPNQPEKIIQVRKKFPQEITPNGNSRIYLDQYSGQVLRIENALKAPLANRIINLQFPLHIGNYGGIGTRIIHVFIGLSPAFLFFTGLVLWRQRQWAKARKEEAIRRSLGIPTYEQEPLRLTEWPWF